MKPSRLMGALLLCLLALAPALSQASSFALLAFLGGRKSVAFQQAYGTAAYISAANTASLPTPTGQFTAGSSVFAAIPSNCGSVTVSVILPTGQSSWTGQLHLYSTTGVLGKLGANPRYDQVDGVVAGTTALAANAVGTFTYPVSVGSAGIICTSYTGSVTPLVVVLPGPTLAAAQVGGSPLPTGASTSALQTTGNSSLSTIATNTTGAATAANQATANTTLASILTALGISLPLPTGGSTSALQTTGNTSLSTIATNTTGAATSALQTTGNTSLNSILTAIGLLATDTLSTTATAATVSTATLQSAATGTGNGTPMNVAGQTTTIFTVVDNFVGTIVWQGTADGTHYGSNNLSPYLSGIGIVTSFTGTNSGNVYIFELGCAGLQNLRVPVTAYSSGSVTVTATAVPSTTPVRNVNLLVGGLPSSSANPVPTQPGDGTNAANVLPGAATAAGQGSLLTAPAFRDITATTSTNQAIAFVDAGNYRAVSATFSSLGTGATNSFQTSNDNVNWFPLFLQASANVGNNQASISGGSTGVIYFGNIPGRYFRINVTGISGSATTVAVHLTTSPLIYLDTPNNTQPIGISTGVQGVQTVYQNAALSNTVGAIKTGSTEFFGGNVYNPNATAVVLELFNVVSGSVSLGTTVPFWHVTIPAGQTVALGQILEAVPIQFGTALSIACVTAYNGSTAPSTAVDVAICYS